MSDLTCYINDDCSEHGRLTDGLCTRHYKRRLKYGDPLGLPEVAPFEAIAGETWRAVPGYEGLYDVSDHGRVLSHSTRKHRGRLLKPFPSGQYGYLAVKLCCGAGTDVTVYVHRLVADTFIGPLKPGEVTRHGPAGHLDNRRVNLSQGSPADNGADSVRDGTSLHGERSHFAKLTGEQAADIRRRVAGGETQKSAGKRYGISQPNVSMLVRNKTWTRI